MTALPAHSASSAPRRWTPATAATTAAATSRARHGVPKSRSADRGQRTRDVNWPSLLTRAVGVELAAAAGLAAVAVGWPGAAGLWVVAAVVLVVTVVRWRRRWLGEWAQIWLAFVLRRAQGDVATGSAGQTGDPPRAELLPVDDGGAVALVVGDSLITAVAVAAEGRLRRVGQASALDIGLLADSALRSGDVEPTELRLVQAVRPVPAGQQTPSARSYLMLQGSRVPAAVDTYLTVRLSRADSPVAVASRGGGAVGAARALRQPLHRLLTALARQGLTPRPVTDPAEMVTACGSAAASGTAEGWRSTHAGGRVHIAFELLGWPQRWSAGGRDRMAALLGGLPCEVATHSASIRRERGALTCRDILRVTARSPRDADDAARALLTRASAAGLRLRRSDGDQLPALWATVPTGAADLTCRLRPHRVHLGQPDGLLLAPGQAGLVLGVDEAASALAARLSGPEPTSVCVVGSLQAASVLAFRAAALGVQVVVETGRPADWGRLVHAAPRAVRLTAAGGAPTAPATAEAPRLHIYDLGAAPPPPARPVSGWETRLTLLPYLHPDTGDAVAHAQLVGLGRVTPDELELLQHLGELPDDVAAALTRLDGDEIYWGDTSGFVRSRLSPTSVERALLSWPRRTADPRSRLSSRTGRD